MLYMYYTSSRNSLAAILGLQLAFTVHAYALPYVEVVPLSFNRVHVFQQKEMKKVLAL
jgi:hypothetical protein